MQLPLPRETLVREFGKMQACKGSEILSVSGSHKGTLVIGLIGVPKRSRRYNL